MSQIRNLKGRVGPAFTKGVSGNPGGRPKAATAMARLIRDRTRDGVELVDFAMNVLRGTESDELKDGKSRRWAADWLSDRGFGKPMQVIELTNDADRPMNLAPLSDAQLEALAELDAEIDAEIEPAAPEPDGDGTAPN